MKVSSTHSLFHVSQDMRGFLNLQNWGLGRGLVKISANCSLVDICSTVIVFLTICDLKWCSLRDRCLVRGRVLWLFAILTQLILSSNVRHLMMGVEAWRGKACCLRSSKRCIIPITSRSAEERAIYSASVVLRAMSDWTLLFQSMGHPAYDMTKPVREWQDKGSIDEYLVQVPAKSASTWHSSPRLLSGWSINPCVLVERRYRPIRLTASSWSRFGLLQNLAHCWTAKVISGRTIDCMYDKHPTAER